MSNCIKELVFFLAGFFHCTGDDILLCGLQTQFEEADEEPMSLLGNDVIRRNTVE